MRIKEGDKWKVVFTIPEELFKLTVIFFGLTSLPAIKIIKDKISVILVFFLFLLSFCFIFYFGT